MSKPVADAKFLIFVVRTLPGQHTSRGTVEIVTATERVIEVYDEVVARTTTEHSCTYDIIRSKICQRLLQTTTHHPTDDVV
jgi:hypothetical protein